MENRHDVLPFTIRASTDRRGLVRFIAERDGTARALASYTCGNDKRRSEVAKLWASDAALQNGAPLAVEDIAAALLAKELSVATQLQDQDEAPAPEQVPATTTPHSRSVGETQLAEMDRRVADGEPPGGLRSGVLTELRVAERLAYHHGRDLRFSTAFGWLVWDGKRWRRDDVLEVQRKAKATVRSMYAEAGAIEDHDERKRFLAFTQACETASRQCAIVKLARSELGVTIRADELDGDAWLLNVENGTLDLRTGELRAADRKDLITKIAPVRYDADATCPVFDEFLQTTFAHDEAMIGFALRALGSSLCGEVRDHVLHLLHGEGANGKSVLVGCVAELLGDYAKTAAPKLLMHSKNDQHPTELADLHGVRFLATAETPEGGRLDENRVKAITGGDRIKGRYMRQDYFEFTPTHTLIISTNHRPIIRGTDFGIWRRVCLWPFTNIVPVEKQDAGLTHKLKAEWPGILGRLVRGCLKWQRDGLKPPDCVRLATDEYRAESDTVGLFVEGCCIECGSDGDPAAFTVKASELYEAYATWTRTNGGHPMASSRFKDRMKRRDGVEQKKWKTGMWWVGVRLNSDAVEAMEKRHADGRAR